MCTHTVSHTHTHTLAFYLDMYKHTVSHTMAFYLDMYTHDLTHNMILPLPTHMCTPQWDSPFTYPHMYTHGLIHNGILPDVLELIHHCVVLPWGEETGS